MFLPAFRKSRNIPRVYGSRHHAGKTIRQFFNITSLTVISFCIKENKNIEFGKFCIMNKVDAIAFFVIFAVAIAVVSAEGTSVSTQDPKVYNF